MRLIDADELINVLKDPPVHASLGGMTMADVLLLVDEAPTIDAVPVVRCKDCVNFEIDDAEGIEDWCATTGARTAEDGYCAWGERKAEP